MKHNHADAKILSIAVINKNVPLLRLVLEVLNKRVQKNPDMRTVGFRDALAGLMWQIME
jgi:hypothetical protein